MEKATSPTIINPFVHRLEFNVYYEKIKVAIMSVTAVPIRAVALLLTLALAWIIAAGGLIGQHDKDMYKKPLSKLHRDFLKPILCQFLRLVFLFCGWHWVSVKGKQASPKEAPILALAPHSSFFDAIIMPFIGAPSIVAKSEIITTPVFGALTRYCEPIYVSRDDPNSRQNTVQEISKRCNNANEWSHSQVAIFPEGTCTNRTCLISFKPGAFLPGVPIQPVCLKYKNRNDIVTWTFDGPSACKLIWACLCQFNNFMEIEFLPVYVPNEQEKRDPILYANNVRKIMAKCLDIPVVNCTYEDHPIILKTLQNNLPIETHLSSIQELRVNLRLGSPRLELSKYTEFTKTKEEHINLQKFADHLSIPISDCVRNLFQLYENEKTAGVINFRDYLLDLCLLCGPVPDSEPPIQLAFKALDKTGRLELQQSQLEKILSHVYNISPSESTKIFDLMDRNSKGYVTFDDFQSFSERKSFFPKLFVGFGDLVSEEDGEEELLKCASDESPSKMKSE